MTERSFFRTLSTGEGGVFRVHVAHGYEGDPACQKTGYTHYRETFGLPDQHNVCTSVYILTVFLSNRGKNPAKYGAKEAPPTAVAREGRMSPAYSISMASNSACWSDSSTSSSSPCWQAVWRKRRQKAL